MSYASVMVVIWPVGVTFFYCVLLYRQKYILQASSIDVQTKERISGVAARNRASGRGDLRISGVVARNRASGIGAIIPAASRVLLSKFSEQINAYLDQNQSTDIPRLFSRLDRDGDGMLSRKDVLWALQYLHVPPIFWQREEDVEGLMQQLEENNKLRGVRLDDFIDVVEFDREYHPHLGGIELLVSGYKPSLWFWEILICVDRLMTTAGLVVFYRGAAVQALSGLIIALSMVSAQACVSPFENDSENNLSLLAHSQIFLAHLAILSFKLEPSTVEFKTAAWTLTVFTILVLVYAVVVTVLRVRHEVVPVLRAMWSTLKSQYAAYKTALEFRASRAEQRRDAILVFHVDSDDEVDRSDDSSSEHSESDDNKDGGAMMPTITATTKAIGGHSSDDNGTDTAQNDDVATSISPGADIAQHDDNDENGLISFMTSISPTARDPGKLAVNEEFEMASANNIMEFLESLDGHGEETVHHIMDTLHASGSLSERQIENIQEALSRQSDLIATNRHRNEMEDDEEDMEDDDDSNIAMTDSDANDGQGDGGLDDDDGALEEDDDTQYSSDEWMDFDVPADEANRA
jgi:hypothetical protein